MSRLAGAGQFLRSSNLPVRMLRTTLGRLLVFLLFFLLLPWRPSPAAGKVREEIFPLSQVRVGMVGTGRTVFEGGKIETFRVKVLGILKKALSGTDLILVRVDSPYLSKKKIGLVRGMSGSPVYFQGKVAGAIAYGWSFSQEPIAGVTPIEAMLSELPTGKPLAGHGARRVSLGMGMRRARSDLAQSFSVIPSYLSPLSVPCQVSGFTPQSLERLKEKLPFLEFVPGGGYSRGVEAPPLVPGAAVGAELVTGDLDMTATGTLTYLKGDKVLAFGHPFLFAGDSEYPLVLSHIWYVLPSLASPFKLSSPIREIGVVSQDRLFAIGGELGKKARMVPIELTLLDHHRKIKKVIHVSAIRNPLLLPSLMGSVVENALSTVGRELGEATASVSYQITLKGFPPLSAQNLVYNSRNIAFSIVSEVESDLEDLLENDFQEVSPEQIKISVSIDQKAQVAVLQEATAQKKELEPGDPVFLTCRLKPYNLPPVEKTIRVQLPQDVTGQVALGISGGLEQVKIRKLLGIPPPTPMTFPQLISLLKKREPNNTLLVTLVLPRKRVDVAGESLLNVPVSLADLMDLSNVDSVSSFPDERIVKVPFPWILVGSKVVVVKVKGKEKPGPPAIPLPPPRPLPKPSPSPPAMPATVNDETAEVSPEKVSADPHKPPSGGTAPPLPPAPPSLPPKKTPAIKGLVEVVTAKDWEKGTFQGVSLTENGSLSLSPRLLALGEVPSTFLWGAAASPPGAGEVWYVAAGNPGKIYQVKQGTPPSLFYDAKTVSVNAVTTSQRGEVIAGTSDGDLLFLDPEGRLKRKMTTGEAHIWALAFQDEGTLLVATGGEKGKVLGLSLESGTFTPLAITPHSHVITLLPDRDRTVYAGTGNGGALVRVNPEGSRIIFDSNQGAIDALAQDSEFIYAGTSLSGKIYKISKSSGSASLFYEFPESHVLTLVSRDGGLMAATGAPGKIYFITGDSRGTLLFKGEDDETFFVRGSSTGEIWLASGHKGRVLQLSRNFPVNGTYTSDILDAESSSRWGTMKWNAEVPEGSSFSIQARTGNTSYPDTTWSSWSQVSSQGTISSPRSRYLQYKISLTAQDPQKAPVIEKLTISWDRVNTPPIAELLSPSGGEFLSKKASVKVAVQDPDEDQVRVRIWWKSVSPSAKGEGEKEVATQWKVTSPDKADEVTLDWETARFPDGRGIILGEVSDQFAHPDGAGGSFQFLSKEITIDNTPPSLTIAPSKITFEKDAGRSSSGKSLVRGEGSVYDKTSPVKEVQLRLKDLKGSSGPAEGNPWIPCKSTDGSFDSQNETFQFMTPPLPAGKRTLEFKATDMAGNEKIETLSVDVP